MMKKSNFAKIICVIFFCIIGLFTKVYSQQDYYLTSGSIPTVIVKQTPMDLSLTITNTTSLKLDSAYLTISLPSDWSISPSSSFNISSINSNTFRLDTVKIEPANSFVFNFQLVALCDADVENIPSIGYNLFNKKDEPLANLTAPFHANLVVPNAIISFPGDEDMTSNVMKESNWSLDQTAGNVIKLKLEILCNTSVVNFENIYYKDNNDVYIAIDSFASTQMRQTELNTIRHSLLVASTLNSRNYTTSLSGTPSILNGEANPPVLENPTENLEAGGIGMKQTPIGNAIGFLIAAACLHMLIVFFKKKIVHIDKPDKPKKITHK